MCAYTAYSLMKEESFAEGNMYLREAPDATKLAASGLGPLALRRIDEPSR